MARKSKDTRDWAPPWCTSRYALPSSYIDAAGCEETRTIMRAELVAIHIAMTIFEDHPWLGVFT